MNTMNRNRLVAASVLLLIAVLCALPSGPLVAFFPAVRYTLAGAAFLASTTQFLNAPTFLAQLFLWPNFLLWVLACVGDPEKVDGLDDQYMGSTGYLALMTGLTLVLLWFLHRAKAKAL